MSRRLRVVAGSAGGLLLVAPPGNDLRPTQDRVKEAVFSALGDRVVDASVLDLFAGTGALAIEALSRGARSAVLVERDPAALDAIRRNLATTRFADRARVERGFVTTVLAGRPPAEAPFDLVLVDPPYDRPDAEVDAVLARLAGGDWLADGGAVVVERAATSSPPVVEGLVNSWERAYGDTLVCIATRRSAPDT
jgi:16S rRNA (guanine966-N2)-methyltransferase